MLVQRLLASQASSDQVDFTAGEFAGREWAEKYATARQLKRLACQFDVLSASFQNPSWIQYFDDSSGLHFIGGREDWLAEVIDPSSSTEDLWSCALGDDWKTLVSEPMFLRGFCEAAVEIWKGHSSAMN